MALVGLTAVFVPVSLIMPGAAARSRTLLAILCAGVIGGYVFWEVFDAWWYLRFLLSAWPAMGLTMAWLLAWPSGRTFTRVGAIALVCVGVYCFWFSYRAGAVNFGEGDRRYVAVARLVRDATPTNSIIFSAQHSGSVRYYGRPDVIEVRLAERAVAGQVGGLAGPARRSSILSA